MTTIEQMVDRCRTGDREAFQWVVEQHQTLLCSLAYGSVGNLARSEDLAQETFNLRKYIHSWVMP